MDNQQNTLSQTIDCGTLFIVSAPSGAGKTTLINALFDQFSGRYAIERVVTYTTRNPRSTEIEGKDYHFVTREQFQQLIEQGFFLEWNSYNEHYYGNPMTILKELDLGKSFILVIDRAGAQEVIKKTRESATIWIYAASIELLRERLISRGTETIEQIEHRLIVAHQEMKAESEQRLYTHHVLNNNFDEALIALRDIFLKELSAKKRQI